MLFWRLPTRRSIAPKQMDEIAWKWLRKNVGSGLEQRGLLKGQIVEPDRRP